MRAAPCFAASALLGLSLAGIVHHQHGHEQIHHLRRDEAILERNQLEASKNTSCVCSTSWSTFYGEPTCTDINQSHRWTRPSARTNTSSVVIQPAEYISTTTQSSIVVQTSTHHITYAPETPLSTSSPSPAPVHSPIQVHKPAAPSPASASRSPPKAAETALPVKQKRAPAAVAAEKPDGKALASHASSPLGTSGSQWCMTYSPYTSHGACKSSREVSADVASIAAKGFSSIRIYSTDCDGLANVASAASSHGMNLVLGVYIPPSGISAARPQIQEIISWATSSTTDTPTNNWRAVEMIVVGNEAVFNAFCTAPALAAFITEARAAFSAAGFAGPVTTSETIAVLSEHAHTLCPVIDVAAANIHPFFNGEVAAQQAGTFVAAEMELLAEICPGNKEVWNLETGWPSRGQPNGVAVPGKWEQRVAVE
ncbi:MAG: hypothetical protein Q9207_005013, partial [Kuettlingeria erythrocarpa]